MPEVGARPFRTTVGVSLSALVLAVALLGVANIRTGPRLVEATVDAASAVDNGGQRLTLRFDQAVAAPQPPDVTVSPRADLDIVSADPSSLVLRFRAALRYDTTYRVEVPALQSRATGARSPVRYAFTTPPATYYVLHRGETPTTGDRISRYTVGQAAYDDVFLGSGISEFAVAAPFLVAVTTDPHKGATLVVDRLDQPTAPRSVLGKPVLTQLHASGPGGVFGFTVGGGPNDDGPSDLYLFNPDDAAGTAGVVAVKDGAGRPFVAVDWAFVPGTTALVAQTPDLTTFLLDPLGGAPPRPLGTHLELDGFVPGSTTLVVGDGDVHTALDLATGTSWVVQPSTSVDEPLLQLLPMPPGRPPLQLRVQAADGDSLYFVTSTDQHPGDFLFAPGEPEAWIQKICASPNGQYLSIEGVPARARPDDYRDHPSFRAITTSLVDLTDGATTSTVDGLDSSWCARTVKP